MASALGGQYPPTPKVRYGKVRVDGHCSSVTISLVHRLVSAGKCSAVCFKVDVQTFANGDVVDSSSTATASTDSVTTVRGASSTKWFG